MKNDKWIGHRKQKEHGPLKYKCTNYVIYANVYLLVSESINVYLFSKIIMMC